MSAENSDSSTERLNAPFNPVIACYQTLSALLTNQQLRALGRLLEQTEKVPDYDSFGSLNVPPKLRETLRQTLDGLRSSDELHILSTVLLALPDHAIGIPIEICWTGPQPHGRTLVRATEPALEELIQSATERILVVGYQIGSGAAAVLSLLREKAQSGVRLTFLIDQRAADKYFLGWLRDLQNTAEVYVRPLNPSDPMSALHAKCVIVDGKQGMFGSANLTFHGMRGNVELGILVKDRTVIEHASNLFDELKGHLTRLRP